MESSLQEAFNTAEASVVWIIFTSSECGPPKPVLEFSEVSDKQCGEVCRIAVGKCVAQSGLRWPIYILRMVTMDANSRAAYVAAT